MRRGFKMDKKMTRSQQGAETKRKLTETALTLFAQKGYNNVSIADICGQVGVTVGVFYHYFRTKSDVFKNISLDGNEKVKNYCFQGETSLEKIAELLDYYAQITQEIGRDTMSVIITPANSLMYTGNYAAKLTASLLEEGQKKGEINSSFPPEVQVRMLFAIVWGIICLWCQHKTDDDLRIAMNESLTPALNGLKP